MLGDMFHIIFPVITNNTFWTVALLLLSVLFSYTIQDGTNCRIK